MRKKIWLPVVIQRTFAFMLSFQLMTFTFFVIGNFQNFLDSTQNLLLAIQKTSGILFILFGLYAILTQFFLWFYERKIRFIRFIITIAGFAVGCVPIVIVYFFLIWTLPI